MVRRMPAAGVWVGLAACCHAQPTFNDVVIGAVPRDDGGTVTLMIDVYTPAGAPGPTPVVLWVHGGGWQGGTYNQVPTFVLELLGEGVAVASARYRLSGEAIFPAQIHDVKGAVRFLRARAGQFNIDPARIACWGSSAGGHLVSLLGTSAGVAAAEGTSGGNASHSSGVMAVVDYYGPSDLINMQLDVRTPPGSAINHDAPTSAESRLLGFDGAGEGIGVLRANLTNPNPPFPALVALATLCNPITHVTPDDPAFLVVHGTADTTVPIGQSERMAGALSAAGVAHEFIQVAGAGHGGFSLSVHESARAFLIAQFTRCDADYTGDGNVDQDDVACIAQAVAGDTSCTARDPDFSRDGNVDQNDIEAIAQVVAGGACP